MTAWAETMTGNLLNFSQVLGGGGSAPMSPPRIPAPPLSPDTTVTLPAISDRSDITDKQRAVLAYQGIDPETAPLSDINHGLGLPKQVPAPASPAPTPPAPATPASNSGTPAVTPVGDGKHDGDGQLSGAAADVAKRLDETLGKNRSAINNADEQLADAILKAQSSSEAGKEKLKQLQDSIIDQVQKLSPTLDTQAGQQQLAEFLRGKASEILNVANNAELDAKSHAALLDGVAAQLDAIGDGDRGEAGNQGEPGSPEQQNQPGGDQPTTPPATPAPSDTPLPGDPLLDGLASDPLMQGLGSLLGPAAGALGGLPQMMGGMMPGMGGGGGLPLGDIGSAIGSAIRGGTGEGQADPLTDPPLNDKADDKPDTDDKGDSKPADDKPEDKPAQTTPAAAPTDAATPNAPQAQSGQVEQAAANDLKVKLPQSGDEVTVANASLKKAGDEVLAGKSIDDSYRNAGLTMSPPGAPITKNMVSRSEGLEFGDVGQFTDHRVMALGNDKVWDNGREIPLKDLQVGTTFLGWERPHTTQPVIAATATTPTPPSRT
ncbi:DUF4226 domain-containing protein [Mycobacterium syngnathidarum]